MSQSDYRDCVCMASTKLNLKFENLPLSVMYYSGGLGGGGGGAGGEAEAELESNKPAKKF